VSTNTLSDYHQQKTIFERLGVTYTQAEDGLLYPNLVLSDPEPHYGKYGYLRKQFLQNHRPALYAQLSMTGKLVSHLNEVDTASTELVERATEEMAKAEGVTEALKETSQMEWVRRTSSIQNRAEEATLRDLIYV
jgi:hypothetical protein